MQSELYKKIIAYSRRKKFNVSQIKKAYKIADRFHKGQKRKSGEPYITHPLMVTVYLMEYEADEESLIAAILHDVVEDTPYQLKDAKEDFGEEVANLIDGLTKFSKNRFRDAQTLDRKIESMRKWFSVMKKDLRVAIIKIVDRVHNMETLDGHKDPKKQRKIAQETLDVYVKIAHKLGIKKLERQLSDLCLKYLDTNAYLRLEEIQQTYRKKENKIRKVIEKKSDIDLIYEEPSLYEIYKLNIHRKSNIEGIYPFSYKITTKTKSDCYKYLEKINRNNITERNGISDSLNNPHPNGYRSIQTKLLTKGEQITVKIQPEAFERYNEYGYTLFCFSKDKQDLDFQLSLQNEVELIVEKSKEDSDIFWEQLENDILRGEITVHTEKNNSLSVPACSTVLDVIFISYGEKALNVKSIFVDGENVPFCERVSEDEVIHCQFVNTPQVSYEWLDLADTAIAQKQIQTGLAANSDQYKINKGKELTNKHLESLGKGYFSELNDAVTNSILKKLNSKNINDLYIKIAEGKILPELVSKEISSKPKALKDTVSKNTVSKNIKILETPSNINKFLSYLPTNLKQNFSYKTNKNLSSLKLVLLNIEVLEWKKIQKYLNRHLENVNIREPFNTKKFLKIAISILAISFLWGINPTLIQYTYNTTDLKLLELVVIRFTLVTIPLISWMGINIFIQKNRTIPIFHPRILLAAIVFSITVYTRYWALLFTIPTVYMVLYRNHNILTESIRTKWNLKSLTLGAALIANTLILLFTPEWSWNSKLISIISVFAFSIYTINNDSFLKKEFIYSRYYQFIAIVHIYSLLLFLFLLLSTTNTKASDLFALTSTHFLLLISLSITAFVPYIIIYYLRSQYKNRYLINISFAGTWIVTFLADIIILGINSGISTFIAGLLMLLGVFFLYQSKKRSQEAVSF